MSSFHLKIKRLIGINLTDIPDINKTIDRKLFSRIPSEPGLPLTTKLINKRSRFKAKLGQNLGLWK